MQVLLPLRGLRSKLWMAVVSFAAASLWAQNRETRLMAAAKAHSTVTYVLHHPMHVIKGVSAAVTCTVHLTPDTTGSDISATLPVSSFDTGNENRDSHALEVVEGLKFPLVRFKGQAVRPESDGTTTGWRVEGEVEFHGVKKTVHFIAHPSEVNGLAHVTGAFSVSLMAHNIERPKLLFVPVDDSLRIELDLTSEAKAK